MYTELLERAVRALRAGPVAGRDVIMVSGSSDVVRDRVSPTQLAEMAEWFVCPAGIDEGTMPAVGLVVLSARRRSGGTTAALWLLRTATMVYRLRTEEVLSRLGADDLPQNSGIVLDGLTPAQAAALRSADLEALDHLLVQRNSRMVLVIGADARVDSAVLRKAITVTPPPAGEVVARHLRFALRDRIDLTVDVDEVLGRSDVQETLASVTEANIDVLQLAEFGRDLADAAVGRLSWEDAARRFTLRAQRAVSDWLDGLNERQLAFTIALAALEGLPNDAIASAAKSLEDAFAAERGERAERGRPEPRHARLAASRAVVTTETRLTRYGPSELEVVRFLDDAHPSEVLSYVWREYDTYHALILDWLLAVAQEPDPMVRIRAATTIGFLARFSFDDVRRRVITPWASSGNHDERERAVAALAIPVRHPNTRGLVLRLVRDWADSGKAALRVTAARALGVSVGESIDGGPDDLLANLARQASPAMGKAIGDSIAELMAESGVERATELLRTLHDWVKDRSDQRGDAAVFAFLEVASVLWVDRKIDGDDRVWWPILLAFTDRTWIDNEQLREYIVALWVYALTWPRADQFVSRVLRAWARAAEAHEEMRRPFVSLLHEAVQQRPRLRRIVLFHARHWRGDGRSASDAPVVATGLLNLLASKSGEETL